MSAFVESGQSTLTSHIVHDKKTTLSPFSTIGPLSVLVTATERKIVGAAVDTAEQPADGRAMMDSQ